MNLKVFEAQDKFVALCQTTMEKKCKTISQISVERKSYWCGVGAGLG